MLGAFRRYGAAHALRAASRTLMIRSSPRELQRAFPSISVAPYTSNSLYRSSPIRFSSSMSTQVEHDGRELNQEQPDQTTASQSTSNSAEHDAPEPEQEKAVPITNFEDLATTGLVNATVVNTITKKMRISTMTEVQSLTISETLQGCDVLAQAKTGTGKTLAFLIPVIQSVIDDPTIKKVAYDGYYQRGTRRSFRQHMPSAADIRAIVISPTRELAEQIATEARRLTFGTGLVVQCAVGGTAKRSGLQTIQREGCHILVATPGRLRDILGDPYSGVEAPKLSALVLDEADRLLDDGFAPELAEIQKLLPDPMKVDRQTLMFSATLPNEVLRMVRKTMKPDFRTIKTVRGDENPTHLSVSQKAVILNGLENIYPTLVDFAKSHLSPESPPFKAIIYFNTTREAMIAFEVFDGLLNDPANKYSGHPFGRLFMSDIHAGLSQNQRTKVSQQFRGCTSGILFSSDVTARGLDFPGVTHILQVGVPRDRQTYIHRLGRTARANQTGEGWVFLHPGEQRFFKKRIGTDIPIEQDENSFPIAEVNMTTSEENSDPEIAKTLEQTKAAFQQISKELKETAYKHKLVDSVGSFAAKPLARRAMEDLAVYGYGLPVPPRIHSQRAPRMFGSDSNQEEHLFRGHKRRFRDQYRQPRGARPEGQFNEKTGEFEFDSRKNSDWHRQQPDRGRSKYRFTRA